MLQHFVYFECRVEIAEVVSNFEQAQPDARHLGVAGKTGEAAAVGEIVVVGSGQGFIGFELSQQDPGGVSNCVDGIGSALQNRALDRALQSQ